MRLSEAIRIGAMLKPQTTGHLHSTIDGIEHSCALGAAGDAIGFKFPMSSDNASAIEVFRLSYMPEEWHDILKAMNSMSCPACEEPRPSWELNVIAHLNDFHRWTRERIADFVELHEPIPLPERESLPVELAYLIGE